MTSRPELQGLIERVEKLVGPVDFTTAAEIAGLSPWDVGSDEWHFFISALGGDLSALGASLALVERVCPKDWQWGEVLHEALRLLSKKYGWHMTFSRPEQLKELPLAVLAVALRSLLAREDPHV